MDAHILFSLFFVFFFVFVGLFVGSFVNVLIYRLIKGEQWVKGRSKCPKCKKDLKWFDLVPLVSWVLLKGKCRYCKRSISVLYPVVEMLCGILCGIVGAGAVSGFYVSGVGRLDLVGVGLFNSILMLLVVVSLVVIFWVDLFEYIIPDEMVILLGTVGLFLCIESAIFVNWQDIVARLLWGSVAAGFFLLLYLITKGNGMGFGDVKFGLVMGLLLKQYVTIALMLAFVLGALVGIVMLISKIRKFGQPIPFGPFLIAGVVFSLIYGRQLLEWYLSGLV